MDHGRYETSELIAALIPAYGLSTRIPRKNMERVHGITLVRRAIHRCEALMPCVVLTQDEEIAVEALRSGAAVLRTHPERSCFAQELVAVASRTIDADAWVLVQPSSPHGLSSGVERVSDALSDGARKAVTVYPESGKRTGSAYGARTECWMEWYGRRPKPPDVMWVDAVLIPSEDGPDVNTPEDLDDARKWRGPEPFEATSAHAEWETGGTWSDMVIMP